METTNLVCGTYFDDRGLPLFFITDDETLVEEPLLVLDYHQLKVLLNNITEYLIVADKYYETDDES